MCLVGLARRFLWVLGYCVAFGRQFFFTAAQFDNYRRNQLLIEQKPTVRFSFKPEKKTVDRAPSLMDAEKLTIGQKL